MALHPWAEMVRFARGGGEANAVAIRIPVLRLDAIQSQSAAITAGMIGI